MTKVIGINCHKWLRVIGLTLWISATIGLGIGIYFGYIFAFIGIASEGCDQLPGGWKNECMNNKIKDDSLFIGTLIGNIGNIIGIWYAVNNKYKFVELKCTTNNQSKKSGLYEWIDGFGHKHILNANESPKTLPKDEEL